MNERSVVVLAGGRSRRFGEEDKALAELAGRPLLAHVVEKVESVGDEVVVSCRSEQIDVFESVLESEPVDEVVVDQFDGAGPLAGIEAAFDVVSGEYTALVACDMPLVKPTVLEMLFERVQGVDAAVPEHPDGHVEPVQAVYRTAAMHDAAIRMLPFGESVQQAMNLLRVVTLPIDRLPEGSFHNVNTERDLARAEQMEEQSSGDPTRQSDTAHQ